MEMVAKANPPMLVEAAEMDADCSGYGVLRSERRWRCGDQARTAIAAEVVMQLLVGSGIAREFISSAYPAKVTRFDEPSCRKGAPGRLPTACTVARSGIGDLPLDLKLHATTETAACTHNPAA